MQISLNIIDILCLHIISGSVRIPVLLLSYSGGELIYVLSINQFPPNTIKVIWEFERIRKKICRHKMSIMFKEICINEEMLPKYTYIYIYTYMCVCMCVCVCVCV